LYKDHLILKQKIDKDGYKEVALWAQNGRYIYRRVHRLVASAFIDNPNDLPIINHKDGDPSNNCVENLEWCTNSHNQLHRYRELGGTWDATRVGRKYTFTEVNAYNTVTHESLSFDCVLDCARHFSVDECCIHNRLHGRTKNPSNSPKSKKLNNWYFTTNKSSNDHPIGTTVQ